VDEDVHGISGTPRTGQRSFTGLCRGLRGQFIAFPEVALANARHQFETAGREFEALVERFQPRFNGLRRPRLGRDHGAHRLDSNGLKLHTTGAHYVVRVARWTTSSSK